MEKKWRPMLRNENIDYSCGWFFVTIQAAFNKTIFGAIVGEKCVLNEFGTAVSEVIEGLESHYPGTYVDCFVVMPNHIHLVVKIEAGPAARQPEVAGNRKNQLGYVIGRFKSYVAKLYRDFKADGGVVDIGETPWQRDYWEKLITKHEQLVAVRKYIEENPKRWSRDRFGLVTSFSYGNIGLLNARLVGFVASQGAYREGLKPRRLWIREAGAAARQPEIKEARQLENGKLISERRATAPADPVISTFTSAQERAIFEKLMKEGRRFVRICPGGLPVEGELEPAIKAACDEGRGLLLSPVASGSGLNKQRAVWCNEYILRNAAEVWAGEITPGHTRASLVAALAPRKQ